MADDGVFLPFVFFQEFLGAGEGHLIDIALHFIGGHADAVVTHGDGFFFSIDADADLAFLALAAVPCHGGHAALLDRIDAIADQFPQEHLMAGIDGLFDDREDVLGMDLNLTLFEHSHGDFLSCADHRHLPRRPSRGPKEWSPNHRALFQRTTADCSAGQRP